MNLDKRHQTTDPSLPSHSDYLWELRPFALQVMLWQKAVTWLKRLPPIPLGTIRGVSLLVITIFSSPLPELPAGLVVCGESTVKDVWVVWTPHNEENIIFALYCEKLTVEGRRETSKGYRAEHYELQYRQAVRRHGNPASVTAAGKGRGWKGGGSSFRGLQSSKKANLESLSLIGPFLDNPSHLLLGQNVFRNRIKPSQQDWGRDTHSVHGVTAWEWWRAPVKAASAPKNSASTSVSACFISSPYPCSWYIIHYCTTT